MVQDTLQTNSSSNSWAVRLADSVLAGYSRMSWKWHYEHGLFLKSILRIGETTGNPRYRQFAHDWIDHFVTPKGRIRTYRLRDFNLDQINSGNLLFYILQEDGNNCYAQAIELLRRQLLKQPRTKSGLFWHKKIYPNQVWLDGLYMAQPFYAGYAQIDGSEALFDDVTHQLILIEKQTRDPITGLLYHGVDESRQQRWAHPETGCSPSFWGRGMGWYVMALVDVLMILPENHPDRLMLIDILKRLAQALARFQDPETGLWYQIVNMADRPGNYQESSVSAMLAYAFAKSVRMDYLPLEFLPVARRAYRGLLENKIKVDAQGMILLEGTCGAAGLGGIPYRDGSFEYYVSEKTIANDFKGVGPFILASVELDAIGTE